MNKIFLLLVLIITTTSPRQGGAPTSSSFGGKIKTVSPKLRKSILDTLKVNGLEIAVITMENGDKIWLKFFPEDAPNTVKNFIMLTNLGFYDSLTFHRVEENFVAQGGDPLGNGSGGAGYNLNAEFNARSHLDGTVAMARARGAPNSASSQFYICLKPQPSLDKQYTVFGQVIRGMDVISKIKIGDRINNIKIQAMSYDDLRLLCKGTSSNVIYSLPSPKSITFPDYPEELRNKRKQGKLLLRIRISKVGEVDSAKVISSEIPEFNEQAIQQIANTWVFTPAKVGYTNIEDWLTVAMEFKIINQYESEIRCVGERKIVEND